jgi:hypothetical protein
VRIFFTVIKAAPAAPLPDVSVGLCLGEARPTHAGPHAHGGQIKVAHTSRRLVQQAAVFLALHCPAPGHRVEAALGRHCVIGLAEA